MIELDAMALDTASGARIHGRGRVPEPLVLAREKNIPVALGELVFTVASVTSFKCTRTGGCKSWSATLVRGPRPAAG